MKYLMLDVDAIVKLVLRAEEVILKDENFHEIVTALRDLSKIERTIIGNNNFNIDMKIIKNLNHLGTIFLTLSGDRTISPIGTKVISDILSSSGSELD